MNLFEQMMGENRKLSRKENQKRRLREAPDMFGLPTDDELNKEFDDEIKSVKDKQSQRRLDIQKQRETKKNELANMDVERELKSLASQYGRKVQDTLSNLARHRDLVRDGGRYDSVSPINSALLSAYRKSGISTGKSAIVGRTYGKYDVLLVSSSNRNTKLTLVITHYWCHNQMFFDGKEFSFTTGGSGVTDARKALEEAKPTFIQEFKSTIDMCLDTINQMCQESSGETISNRREVMGDIDDKLRELYPELNKKDGFQSNLRSGHMAYFYPALMPFDEFQNQILSNFNEYKDNLIFGKYNDVRDSFYYFGMKEF